MHLESLADHSTSACAVQDLKVGKGELKAEAAVAAVELPVSQTMRM